MKSMRIGTTPVFTQVTGTMSPSAQCLSSALVFDTAMLFGPIAVKLPATASKSNSCWLATGSAATMNAVLVSTFTGAKRIGVEA